MLKKLSKQEKRREKQKKNRREERLKMIQADAQLDPDDDRGPSHTQGIHLLEGFDPEMSIGDDDHD